LEELGEVCKEIQYDFSWTNAVKIGFWVKESTTCAVFTVKRVLNPCSANAWTESRFVTMEGVYHISFSTTRPDE
jgi:hypothetical protein